MTAARTPTRFAAFFGLPLLLCAALLTLPGCAGYQLGSTLPPGIRTVHVPIVINETNEPDVESETTRALIQELQKEGSLRVVSEDQADLVLQVKVRHVTTDAIRYRRDRATTGSEYRMLMQADISVVRRADKSVFLERADVAGEATFVLAGDLRTGKRNALPIAARDLSHDIVEAVVESW